jgi:hypothetical protein
MKRPPRAAPGSNHACRIKMRYADRGRAADPTIGTDGHRRAEEPGQRVAAGRSRRNPGAGAATAAMMIAISDNTAADMLIQLVGRSAVEAPDRQWSDHADLNVPFLTARESLLMESTRRWPTST